MSVTIGGTFSGLNVSSIISSIIAADSIPITNLQTTDTNLTTQSTDLGDLGTSLGELSSTLQSLGANSLFSSQTATVATPTVGTATVGGSATAGTFSIDIQQLASSTVLRSGSATGTVANTKVTAPPAAGTAIGTVLNETDVAGQTFSINGKTITLAATDTLSGVMTKIDNSGAGVTATYDATTGNVSLASASNILLGSGADTSDFLQQAELFNNGTGAVTSTTGLGRLSATANLATAGLNTTPTAGTFTINGVPITYSAGDSLNDLIGNINASGAGVTAVYDTYEDQIALSSTSRGAQSITVADGTSNIASALRLTSADSTLDVGQSTLFTVNGGTTVRQSNSNVIDSGTLGVPGVTFTATGTGSTQVTVAPDVTDIATAINKFVTQYNATQTVINSFTTVDPSDSTQDGPLATDTNLTFLAPQIRQVTSGSVSNTATIRMLSDLGIDTNATDNTLTQVDTSKLTDALTNHLKDVEALFNDPTKGLTTTVQNVISSYSDSLNGVIVNEQNNISQQIAFNKQQITQMQEQITAEQTQLENEFAALDEVESQSSGLSSIFAGAAGSTSTAAASTSTSLGSVGGTTTSSSDSSGSSSSS
jgi:flagellar hook-associated protein 2